MDHRPPLSLSHAEIILRNRHLGWEAGTLEEAQGLRAAAMSEGLSPMPAEPCPACVPVVRRARVSGMILGLALALLTFAIGVIIRVLIESHWPIACDGTASIGSCAVRVLGSIT